MTIGSAGPTPELAAGGAGQPVTYRMYGFWRPLVFGAFGAFGVFALGILIATAAGKLPLGTLGFLAAWLAAAGWNAYWFLLRIVYRLDLDGDRLRWWTPLRSGSVAVNDIRAVEPWSFTSQIEAIRASAGPPVLVLVRRGFGEFADALGSAAPQADVRLGAAARVIQRVPGPSRFRPGRR